MDLGQIFILIVVGLVIAYFVQRGRGRALKKIKTEELRPIETISVGKYLVGLPDGDSPRDEVDCGVTENDLVFLSGVGEEIGKIPRNAINQIVFDDKSQISQRLTVTRMMTLGILSLAAPKATKHKEYCIVIDWNDDTGTRWNTIFEFSGMASETASSYAFNKLTKYLKPKETILRPNEKKCQYCAEVIKNEAIVCRFCGRDLP